jgi:hypothetical protein
MIVRRPFGGYGSDWVGFGLSWAGITNRGRGAARNPLIGWELAEFDFSRELQLRSRPSKGLLRMATSTVDGAPARYMRFSVSSRRVAAPWTRLSVSMKRSNNEDLALAQRHNYYLPRDVFCLASRQGEGFYLFIIGLKVLVIELSIIYLNCSRFVSLRPFEVSHHVFL